MEFFHPTYDCFFGAHLVRNLQSILWRRLKGNVQQTRAKTEPFDVYLPQVIPTDVQLEVIISIYV